MSQNLANGLSEVLSRVRGRVRSFFSKDDYTLALTELLIVVIDKHGESEMERLAQVLDTADVDQVRNKYQSLSADATTVKKVREKSDTRHEKILEAYSYLHWKREEILKSCNGPDPQKECAERYHAWIQER